jgi:hypothetical protein
MLPFRDYVFSDTETEDPKKFSGQRIFSPKIILENFISLEERCLGEANSDTNSSDARSSDISCDFQHRANDARDG